MKKISIIIITIISLIITLIGAEVTSLYHFGDIPTLLTLSYLISIFFIFEDILLSIVYIATKKIRKEKISLQKIVGMILLFLALLLVLWFIVSTNVDWLNYYSRYNSSPFYVFVLENALKYLLPSLVLIIISVLLIKAKRLDK